MHYVITVFSSCRKEHLALIPIVHTFLTADILIFLFFSDNGHCILSRGGRLKPIWGQNEFKRC